jgi:3-phenylpropionate/trans-cinnamate dioxygenase ferredoxin component
MSVVQLQRAARLADVSPGIPLAVTLPDGQRICLIKADDRVYAIADRCSHKDFAMSGGDMVAPCVIECPWHGARFDVRTGQPALGPATAPLTTYSVRVMGEEVFVGGPRTG